MFCNIMKGLDKSTNERIRFEKEAGGDIIGVEFIGEKMVKFRRKYS